MKKVAALLISFLLFIPFASIDGGNVASNMNTNNTLYVGGSGPNNYTKIQDAINDASNGDTIFVYSGIYPEHVRIYKPINLIGENENTTIIDGMNETDVTVFSITANHVNFSHFTIRNISGGKWTFGIKIEDGNHIEISNCIIKECDGIGIFSTDNISIENCNISQNYWGLDIRGGNNIEIGNCTISYNIGKKDDNGWLIGGDGIFAEGVSEGPISNIRITNCSIYHNGDGVEVFGASNVFISNCDINTYNFSGINIGPSIFNCTILDCNISHGYVGIDMGSVDAKIGNCSITGNFWGIRMGSTSKDAKVFIRYNNIENNSYGIYVCTGISNSYIDYNNIYNNGIGMKAEFSVCNARNNYWGSPLGPSHLFGLRGDRIQTTLAKVFYFPWLKEECKIG